MGFQRRHVLDFFKTLPDTLKNVETLPNFFKSHSDFFRLAEGTFELSRLEQRRFQESEKSLRRSLKLATSSFKYVSESLEVS